ncbi:DUF7504 family protein [Natrononativus amylolyticus]|uniref:DUF7504 family protein n=1 Tax=Natrononativus amylolyticus TaxID=2963434 RepID=UPI0020CCFB60|nr:HalOD1 output domain-containing protein [Natrononativus amylolyticus]
MTNDRSSRTPPSRADVPPLEATADPLSADGCTSVGIATISMVAAAVGTRPLELPPLNEAVDMDALDSLFAAAPEDSRWPLVEFTYAGHRVRITPDDGPELVDDGAVRPPVDRPWPHVTPIEAAPHRSLMADVVVALSDRSEYEPATLRDELAESVDFDALEAVSRPRANGIDRTGASVRFSVLGFDVVVDSGGRVAVGSALDRFAHAGGNVLVLGDVPDALVESACAGVADRSHDRHLLAVLDRDVESVAGGLPAADATSAHVVNHVTALRSAASAFPGGETNVPLSVTDVSGDLEDVREVIEAKLDALAPTTADEPPLCVAVTSLRPVVESRDDEEARSFLEPICAAVTEQRAVGSYVLPVGRETAPVPTIEPLFDATLELRVHGTAAQRRWHFHGSSHTTDWSPLHDG